jgi:hypothetical protein
MNIRESAKKKLEDRLTVARQSAPPESVISDLGFVEGYLDGFKDAIAQFKYMVQCVQINDDETSQEQPPSPPQETL